MLLAKTITRPNVVTHTTELELPWILAAVNLLQSGISPVFGYRKRPISESWCNHGNSDPASFFLIKSKPQVTCRGKYKNLKFNLAGAASRLGVV